MSLTSTKTKTNHDRKKGKTFHHRFS
jgi:hypothetical protein